MTDVFCNLLALSIGVSPIIIILLCLGSVLNKRYSARWRYIMWMVISIRLLLPVSFTDGALLSIQVPAETGAYMPANPLPEIWPDLNPAVTGADISLMQILAVIYLIGVCTYLVGVATVYAAFRRNVMRWSRKPSDDRVLTVLMDLKNELNIKKEIPVRISKKIASPMLVGLIKPTLLLPAESYADADLRLILSHELIHLKRHDVWYKLTLTAATALHWFNPLVYLMAKEANKDMEISCDNYVLKDADTDTKKYYSNIILNSALQDQQISGPVLSTGIRSSKSTLKSRIIGIFDQGGKRRGRAALIVIALLMIFPGVTIAMTEAAIPVSDQNSGPVSPTTSSYNLPKSQGDKAIDANGSMETDRPPFAESNFVAEGPKAITPATNYEEYVENRTSAKANQESGAEVVVVDLEELEKEATADNYDMELERQ